MYCSCCGGKGKILQQGKWVLCPECKTGVQKSKEAESEPKDHRFDTDSVSSWTLICDKRARGETLTADEIKLFQARTQQIEGKKLFEKYLIPLKYQQQDVYSPDLLFPPSVYEKYKQSSLEGITIITEQILQNVRAGYRPEESHLLQIPNLADVSAWVYAVLKAGLYMNLSIVPYIDLTGLCKLKAKTLLSEDTEVDNTLLDITYDSYITADICIIDCPFNIDYQEVGCLSDLLRARARQGLATIGTTSLPWASIKKSGYQYLTCTSLDRPLSVMLIHSVVSEFVEDKSGKVVLGGVGTYGTTPKPETKNTVIPSGFFTDY